MCDSCILETAERQGFNMQLTPDRDRRRAIVGFWPRRWRTTSRRVHTAIRLGRSSHHALVERESTIAVVVLDAQRVQLVHDHAEQRIHVPTRQVYPLAILEERYLLRVFAQAPAPVQDGLPAPVQVVEHVALQVVLLQAEFACNQRPMAVFPRSHE